MIDLDKVWGLVQSLLIYLFLPFYLQLLSHYFLKCLFFFPLNCFCLFVKNQLAVIVWGYFWVLYSFSSVSLIYALCLHQYYISLIIGAILKKPAGTLMGIVSNLYINLGRIVKLCVVCVCVLIT